MSKLLVRPGSCCSKPVGLVAAGALAEETAGLGTTREADGQRPREERDWAISAAENSWWGNGWTSKGERERRREGKEGRRKGEKGRREGERERRRGEEGGILMM